MSIKRPSTERPAEAELAPEKMHISVLPIDKPRFPSIRSDDLMAIFKNYGSTCAHARTEPSKIFENMKPPRK